MKKLLSLCLSIVLVLVSATMAFGISVEPAGGQIKLNISSSEEDLEFIKQYAPEENVSLNPEDNQIVLDITENETMDDEICVSGDVNATMYGQLYQFSFEDKGLAIKQGNEGVLYSDCFSTEIDETHEALMDITATEGFEQAIISLTIVDLITDEQQIMLYGDTFTEQTTLFQQEMKIAEQKAIEAENSELMFIESENSDVLQPMASSSSAYQHVSNKSNSTLAGEAREKQMMVMNISKCDPQNFGSGNQGYELIRVFSRAYNVPKVEATVLLAEPKGMYVKFAGDSDNLFQVDGTKPSTSSSAIESVFRVFTSIVGATLTGPLAVVNAAISTLPLSIGDYITISGTNATFDVSVDDYDTADMDLPAATASSDAETDTSHGVTFKVLYTQDAGKDTATITVSSNVTYRVYLNTDRTSTMKTGTATYSHVVNLN